ncbi:MAG TPA: helicase-related protein, partial [Nitrosomonas sp.]|nr:helicase-related protein [Nitrosomonas sp.]
GKTVLLAMLAKHAQQTAEIKQSKPFNILVLARTGDLIDQNAEKMWEIGARNSIFSQSLKIKSTKYSVICGTERTVFNALETQLKDRKIDILAIDEAYQVNYAEPDCQYMKIIAELIRRNPNLSIIGYGGSLYRGTRLIIGDGFWKHLIFSCSFWQAIELGYVCAPVFGYDDLEYEGLESIHANEQDGTDDLSKDVMAEQNKIILKQKPKTHAILTKVNEVAKTHNCVLITCAGKKHIDQCIEALREIADCCDYRDLVQDGAPEPLRYAVVTEKTTTAERREIKKLCNTGKIKYVLQVGCWTVGVNIPMFDLIVILRRIGSRTLLEQLVGRGARWLEEWQKKLGFFKAGFTILDYAGTFEAMAEFFDDELIQAAQLSKSRKNNDTIFCPCCNTENPASARRCRSRDPLAQLTGKPLGKDGRCTHYWSSKLCPSCGAENDKVARSCRECDQLLVDPNANLTGKHYTDDDWQRVVSGKIGLTKDAKKILAQYQLESGEVAKEVLDPSSKEQWIRIKWEKFFRDHMPQQYATTRGINARTPLAKLLAHLPMFDKPEFITHRLNDKGYSIIAKKKFGSGREVVE